MYRLLHNLLPCRETLFKWKKEKSNVCPLCEEIETIKHIYYDCQCINHVWISLGRKLKIDLTWEKIILGFTQDITIHRLRNMLFTIIMYARYKLWARSTEQLIGNHDFTNILNADTCKWNFIIKSVNLDKNHNAFKDIWNKINVCDYAKTLI